MILDEFAGLKRMDSIENAVAQIAGFGVKLFFVLQSLEQLKYTYTDNWETFLSNAGVKVFFSVEDHFTRDYVSKLAGETEIIRELQSSNQSQSENESYAKGRSTSHTVSRSTTSGTSGSYTEGDSVSRTQGTSQSASQSHTAGTNTSTNRGGSTSFNQSVSGPLGWFGAMTPGSKSRGTSQAQSYGSSQGTSSSSTSGTTDGTSSSDTYGGSTSRTKGISLSETFGSSETEGTSETHTRGTSRTTGTGRNESLHFRPLIQPDEVGRVFTRIDDRESPAYPGFALVMMTGANPVVLRRANYFEDPQFINCFSPHPDHPFIAAKSHVRREHPAPY